MEGKAPADEFIPAGLASLGIEADEVELAVMGAVHGLIWPPVLELLALDTEGVEPERDPDMSRPPQRARSDQASISDSSRREQSGSSDE
jgi:hypothetical protein